MINTDNIFYIETNRINKAIKKVNKHGFNLPKAINWDHFLFLKLKDDNKIDINTQKLSDENLNDILTEKEHKEYQTLYLKYLDSIVLRVLDTFDIDKLEKAVCIEDSKSVIYTEPFRKNGFFCFLKERIWKVDLKESEETIFNKLLLDWYDLDEIERNLYRKFGKSAVKKLPKKTAYRIKSTYFIKNYMDIDLGWDSEEEWIL